MTEKKQRLQLNFQIGLLMLDLGAINLAIFFAYYLRFKMGLFSFMEFHVWRDYAMFAITETLFLPLVFVFQGLYRLRRSRSRIDELQAIFTAVSMATVLAVAASAFLSRDFAFSRALLALAWIFGVVLIWLLRLLEYRFHGWLSMRTGLEDRVLIVGAGELGRAIEQKIRQSPHLGYRALGFADKDPSAPIASDLPLLGRPEEVGSLVRAHGITEVIIADPSLSHQDILEIVAQCDRERVNIRVFPDVFQLISAGVSIGDLDGLPMVSVRDVALRGWNLALKRAVDLAISFLVLTFLSPLMLLIGLLVKVTSPGGPAFYVQERVGLDGTPFQVIKFRSMRHDAEEETGPVWTVRSDPRVTPFGRLLRRFSLDELPQFINVLLGEMSVVGPRPERPHFVQEFSQKVPRYLERHKEKAGLTGWAQVNGLRGNVSIEERTTYDLWYVENWTLWLDFKIMLRTLVTILKDRNAY